MLLLHIYLPTHAPNPPTYLPTHLFNYYKCYDNVPTYPLSTYLLTTNYLPTHLGVTTMKEATRCVTIV
jgi:hypothetical protein